MTGPGRRSAVAGFSLLLTAGLAVGGCGGGSSSAAPACPAKTGKAVTASSPLQRATGKPAAGWTLPGADLANTRDVASTITSANVAKLGVAWTVPLHTSLSHTDGAYVLPRAEHLRRHRDPAGQQRLDHVRRRQRPCAAGVPDRLHRGGGR
jgi:hypothetical protein